MSNQRSSLVTEGQVLSIKGTPNVNDETKFEVCTKSNKLEFDKNGLVLTNQTEKGSMKQLIVDKDGLKRTDINGNEHEYIYRDDLAELPSNLGELLSFLREYKPEPNYIMTNTGINHQSYTDYVKGTTDDPLRYTISYKFGPLSISKNIDLISEGVEWETDTAGNLQPTSATAANLKVNESTYQVSTDRTSFIKWIHYMNLDPANSLSSEMMEYICRVVDTNTEVGPYSAGRLVNGHVCFLANHSGNYREVYFDETTRKFYALKNAAGSTTEDVTTLMTVNKTLSPNPYLYNEGDTIFSTTTNMEDGYSAQLVPIFLCFLYIPHVHSSYQANPIISVENIQFLGFWIRYLLKYMFRPYGLDCKFMNNNGSSSCIFHKFDGLILRNVGRIMMSSNRNFYLHYGMSNLKEFTPGDFIPHFVSNEGSKFRDLGSLSAIQVYNDWHIKDMQAYGGTSFHAFLSGMTTNDWYKTHPLPHNTNIDLSHFDASLTTNITHVMHADYYTRGKVTLWKEISPFIVSLECLFYIDYCLDAVDGIWNWNTMGITNFANVFRGTYNLLYLDITNWSFKMGYETGSFLEEMFSLERLYIKKSSLGNISDNKLRFTTEHGDVTPHIQNTTPYTISQIKYGNWNEKHDYFTYADNGDVAEIFLDGSNGTNWNTLVPANYRREYRYVIEPIWHKWDPVSASLIKWVPVK